MPQYRRAIVPGGTFFFTIVTHQRKPIFSKDKATRMLGSIIRKCQSTWPMEIHAIVLLPDHWHVLISLPPNDFDYSKRIAWIKRTFTRNWLLNGGTELPISEGKRRQRRRGVWQPRFWEHLIDDTDEFDAYFDYIHWNPVKHGLVDSPSDWPHSSFHRWVTRNVYPRNWGRGSLCPESVKAVITNPGEP